MPEKTSKGRRAKPYILVVGVLALIHSLFGRQIQAWVMSLPPGVQVIPLFVILIVASIAAAIALRHYNRG